MSCQKGQETDIYTLEIDLDDYPCIPQVEYETIHSIQNEFLDSYANKTNDLSTEDWLKAEIEKNLGEGSSEDAETFTKEIVATISASERYYSSADSAADKGISNTSWFSSEIQKATSHLSNQEAARYLSNLDKAVFEANNALQRTITTNSGVVSQNPNLDGFIAEQYHAQTFNMNAEAKGSQYRAEVLEPEHGYGKNSVDIVIKDGEGKIARRYQSKYYKDAKATEKAFEDGDYRGQRKLVPSDQEVEKTSQVLVAPDGTTSNPLSKERAQQMRDEAQSGNWNDLNWNEYALKDVAIGIGKQCGKAALFGLAIGIASSFITKKIKGEKVATSDMVKAGLVSGGGFALKAALSGALKVAVEKGWITIIPKGTPASQIANIVHVAVEDFKVIYQYAKGEYTFEEAVNKVERVTLSTIAGICASAKAGVVGAKVGTSIGAILGPAGAVVGGVIGGFVGSVVGYAAASAVTDKSIENLQQLQKKAVEKAIETAQATSENKNSVHINNLVIA